MRLGKNEKEKKESDLLLFRKSFATTEYLVAWSLNLESSFRSGNMSHFSR